MSCDRAAQVHAYHDGRLTAQDRAAVEDHLRACGDCAALLSDLRGLSRLITAAPRAELSTDALARMRESFRAASERSILRISSWLTAAAAAVLIGALLSRPAGETEPGNGGTMIASAAVWQTRAVMPPTVETQEGSELILLAQWMADELELPEGQR